jgi:hypothetical protein
LSYWPVGGGATCPPCSGVAASLLLGRNEGPFWITIRHIFTQKGAFLHWFRLPFAYSREVAKAIDVLADLAKKVDGVFESWGGEPSRDTPGYAWAHTGTPARDSPARVRARKRRARAKRACVPTRACEEMTGLGACVPMCVRACAKRGPSHTCAPPARARRIDRAFPCPLPWYVLPRGRDVREGTGRKSAAVTR